MCETCIGSDCVCVILLQLQIYSPCKHVGNSCFSPLCHVFLISAAVFAWSTLIFHISGLPAQTFPLLLTPPAPPPRPAFSRSFLSKVPNKCFPFYLAQSWRGAVPVLSCPVSALCSTYFFQLKHECFAAFSDG